MLSWHICLCLKVLWAGGLPVLLLSENGNGRGLQDGNFHQSLIGLHRLPVIISNNRQLQGERRKSILEPEGYKNKKTTTPKQSNTKNNTEWGDGVQLHKQQTLEKELLWCSRWEIYSQWIWCWAPHWDWPWWEYFLCAPLLQRYCHCRGSAPSPLCSALGWLLCPFEVKKKKKMNTF